MTTYEIHITSKDPLGINLIENIVSLAQKGAYLKPTEVPMLRFPHHVKMILESDEAPEADPYKRVFDAETHKEIKPTPVEVKKADASKTFSLDEKKEDEVVEDVEDEVKDEESDKASDEQKSYTKEELDAMDWKDLQKLASEIGVIGRDRKKLTTAYLAKTAK